MSFLMRLVEPAHHSPVMEGAESPEDFESLIMIGSALLADSGYEFLVSGFGQQRWPVDVGYDLSTVVEQLPDVLTSILASEIAELDFYGQGIERVVEFSRTGDVMELRCQSRTGWTPDPEVETLDVTQLEEMMVGLAHDFSNAIARLAPRLAAIEPLPSWQAGTF
jgi:hypothetical protein